MKSTATITIEADGHSLVVRVEASPPLLFTEDELDIEKLTTAGAAAVYGARAIGEAGDHYDIVKAIR